MRMVQPSPSIAAATYITGAAYSLEFPLVTPEQSFYLGNGASIVSKLTPDGSSVVYATYLGGSGADYGYGLAVDSSHAVYNRHSPLRHHHHRHRRHLHFPSGERLRLLNLYQRLDVPAARRIAECFRFHLKSRLPVERDPTSALVDRRLWCQWNRQRNRKTTSNPEPVPLRARHSDARTGSSRSNRNRQ